MGGHLAPVIVICLSLSITSRSGDFKVICWHCPDSHTGENLATRLESMLVAWIKTMECCHNWQNSLYHAGYGAAGVGYFHCFSHSLQLAINQALAIQQISKALAHARNLVTDFQHLTHWNLAYYLLQRVSEQQQPLCATLVELKWPDLMPTDAEITAMEIFMEVTEPFLQITGAEKWVTSMAAWLLLYSQNCLWSPLLEHHSLYNDRWI